MIDIQLLRKDPDGGREAPRRRAARARSTSRSSRRSRTRAGARRPRSSRRRRCATSSPRTSARRRRTASTRGDADRAGREAEGGARPVGRGTREAAGGACRTSSRRIPNIPHESVPVGASAEDNREERRWGAPRKFDFPVKDHVDVGAGARRPRLRRRGEDRRRALRRDAAARWRGCTARIAQFMLDVHTRDHGYTEVYAPYLVNSASAVRHRPACRSSSRTCSRSHATATLVT